MTEARYPEGLEFALRFADLAPRLADPMQVAMGHRVVGLLKWRNGDFPGPDRTSTSPGSGRAESRLAAQRVARYYQQGVAARASAASFLWLTGFADQAVAQARPRRWRSDVSTMS